jgi:hypothetical protein
LSQQDYKGKRVHIIISDGNRQVTTKLDIGVQADLTIAQEDYYFDVSGNEESVCLLGNTKEQIFGEKLVSLLKWGVASTRFKDIHDFYYLGHEEGFDKAKLDAYLEKWVYSSGLPKLPMRDKGDVQRFIASVLEDDIFRRNFVTSHDRWLDVDDEAAFNWLIGFVGE